MRRILVVDDDQHTGLAIGPWLKQCGFRGVLADGDESGLAALNDGTFDLMIVDVFTPNMRGLESIRVFHDQAPAVPDRDFEPEQRRKHASALSAVAGVPRSISSERVNTG